MTVHVGTYDAKTRLSELLDRVARGEDVVITRHGKPVAKLVAADDKPLLDKRTEAVERIRALRESLPVNTLDGLSIKDMIEEGRR